MLQLQEKMKYMYIALKYNRIGTTFGLRRYVGYSIKKIVLGKEECINRFVCANITLYWVDIQCLEEEDLTMVGR